MDAFIGTVLPVAFNYAPRGWVFCNGQLLAIQSNSALFALLGTMYGGDGRTTFGVPDLRGRSVFGSQAQGPGLANIVQGELGGHNSQNVTSTGNIKIDIGIANLPAHTHTATLNTSGLTATTNITVGTGTNGGLAAVANNGGLTSTAGGSATAAAIYLPANTAPTTPVNLGGVTTTISGSGAVTNANTGSGMSIIEPVSTTGAVSTMPPYLGLNYIICVDGIFPSRN